MKLRAITLELARFQGLLAAHINSSLVNTGNQSNNDNRSALRSLLQDINLYITGILNQPLRRALSRQLPQCLLIIQYAYNLLETLDELDEEAPLPVELLQPMNDWLLLHDRPEPDSVTVEQNEAEQTYQALKQQLLDATVEEQLSLTVMNQGLQRLSLYKRLQEQTLKAAQLLRTLQDGNPSAEH